MNKFFPIQNKINERILLIALLFSLFVMFLLIAFFSETTFDIGDGLRHYMISRYSWKHPGLFLDSWGKPFFTLVSSPFSQLGLLGTNVFNILCAVFSSYLCYLIAKRLDMKFPLIVILLLCFSSIYFPTMNSGLTEPFFSLVFILSVYFMFEEKYFASAVIVSFLPYVRSEGYLILPLFFILLLYRRKIFFIPWLALGTIVYSIVGYFYYDDILWIKNNNPYNGNNGAIYGHGELLHFVRQYANIFGKPLTILLLFGIVYLFYKLFFLKSKFSPEEKKQLPEEIFLIYGSAIVVFVAHSVFWWKGIVGSLGLIRVMAGIMPAAALIGLRGLNFIFIPLEKIKSFWLHFVMLSVILFFIIKNPFRQDYFPYHFHPEQPVVIAAGEWIKQSEYSKEKIYFLHPFLPFVLSFDPFDSKNNSELWGLYDAINEQGIDFISKKSLIVWDAHYAANEGDISLDKISNDPNFRLLKIFKPKEGFTVLGGYPFAVYVFSREKSLDRQILSTQEYDFENPETFKNFITEEKAFSGKFSYKVSAKNEYGFSIEKNTGDYPNLKEIHIKAKIYSYEKLHDISFVMQMDNPSAKMLSWESKTIKTEKYNEWEDFDIIFSPSSELINSGNSLKLYIWNPKGETLFIDDIKIEFQ